MTIDLDSLGLGKFTYSSNKQSSKANSLLPHVNIQELTFNDHLIKSYRLKTQVQNNNHHFQLALKAEFKESLHIYKNIASGFPLVDGENEFLTLYDKNADIGDLRIRDSFAPRVDNTFHDIKGYNNVIAFRAGTGSVIVFFHRGATKMTRLDVKNNGGKYFSLGVKTVAPYSTNDEFEFITYHSDEERFWWQPALEYADATGIPQNLFRIALKKITDNQMPELYILGRREETVNIDVRSRAKHNAPWLNIIKDLTIDSDVTCCKLDWKDRKSGIYEIRVSAPNIIRNTIFVQKPKPNTTADILYVFGTNAWRSYAMNGHYHGPIDHCFPWSYSYSATIMEGVSDVFDDVVSSYRYPMQPEYYNNMPSGFARLTSGFINSLEIYCNDKQRSWHACGEEDIADGSINLSNYRLVFLDNHAEYSTPEEMTKFMEYLDDNGVMVILGGDALGRRVDYIRDDKGNIRYQKLFNNSVLGIRDEADNRTPISKPFFPYSSQYSNAQRLDRFGLCYSRSPGMLEKVTLKVSNNNHPITDGYKINEVISESRWECDYVNPDWNILISVYDNDGVPIGLPAKKMVSLAIHPSWNLCYLGPMGINETLAGYYGNKPKVHTLFSNIIDYYIDIVKTP